MEYRIEAGLNLAERHGRDAQAKIKACLVPNENGYYEMPVYGGAWTIGINDGKFGTYAKFKGEFLSVNNKNIVYAKVGSAKEKTFIALANDILNQMYKVVEDVYHGDLDKCTFDDDCCDLSDEEFYKKYPLQKENYNV